MQPFEKYNLRSRYLSNRSPPLSQTCTKRKRFLCLVWFSVICADLAICCMTSTCQTGAPPRKFSGKVQNPMRMLRTKLYTTVQSETTVPCQCYVYSTIRNFKWHYNLPANGYFFFPNCHVFLHFLVGLVSLRSVLSFFSGGEEIPPMGFQFEPELNFNPDNVYPTASTCAVQLTLPTRYKEYEAFKHAMTIGFTCHGGLGLK